LLEEIVQRIEQLAKRQRMELKEMLFQQVCGGKCEY
jgi:hypothetical protein